MEGAYKKNKTMPLKVILISMHLNRTQGISYCFKTLEDYSRALDILISRGWLPLPAIMCFLLKQRIYSTLVWGVMSVTAPLTARVLFTSRLMVKNEGLAPRSLAFLNKRRETR